MAFTICKNNYENKSISNEYIYQGKLKMMKLMALVGYGMKILAILDISKIMFLKEKEF